jgi:hypothetical protein
MKKAIALVLAVLVTLGAFGVTYAARTPGLACLAASTGIADLSETEKTDLLYVIEEEKLARDVYSKLHELWGTRSFAQIAEAEDRHVSSIRALLQAAKMADPTASAKAGEFLNAQLQALYEDLVKKGSESLAAALTVGASIEDLDIFDLEAKRAATQNATILAVYDNLIKGSENHMRAFVGQLGADYDPQHISKDRLAQIMAGTNAQQRGLRGDRQASANNLGSRRGPRSGGRGMGRGANQRHGDCPLVQRQNVQ